MSRDYTYGDSAWGDLLTNWHGYDITYDEIGNVLSDRDSVFTWEHGRELTSMTAVGFLWQFSYDQNGMRTSRTNGNRVYNYVYNGDSLRQVTVDNHDLNFTYDTSGKPLTLIYDGTAYWYDLNLQGDVVGILDSYGNTVVRYTYNAWGCILSITGSEKDTVGFYNPLRYRGYAWDPETGLYYLQTRYYSPGLGRFINADAYASTGQGLLGNNMFAYCLNNPINYSDHTGKNAAAEGLKNGIWILPFLDGPLPIGEFIVIIGFFGILLLEQANAQKEDSTVSSQSVNWNPQDNLKNHILKGTKGKHKDGWRRFGIDPDDRNAWKMLVPILKEAMEKADEIITTALPDGSKYIEYIKTYVEQGVQVVFKVWTDPTGAIQKISDAKPYIIN